MVRTPLIPCINSVRSKKLFLLLLLVGSIELLKSQSILGGGFISVALADSNAGHNAGGMAMFQHEHSSCLLVNGGMVFGQTELFNRQGLFREDCREFSEETGTDIKVFPNPGIGLYQVMGLGVVSCAVSDQQGRTILMPQTWNPEQYRNIVDLRPFSEGLYHIHLTLHDGRIYTENLIKINP